MDKLFKKYQLAAYRGLPTVFARAAKALLGRRFKECAALLLVVVQLFGMAVFKTPVNPYGQPLDLEKRFDLVWSDEFDNGFDTTKWQGHYVYGAKDTQKRDTAYWNRSQVSFTDDGCLKITVEYKDGPAGEQYYAYGMETNPNKRYDAGYEGYEQLYGYFETRCILPKGSGLNPAFWMLTDGMWADDTGGGVTGCELDIFETETDYNVRSPYFNSVYHTIHVDGYEEAHRREGQGDFYADDPYNKFNTYGVEWNPDGYIFYINGVETARTDFGGVCQVPLYLILSVGVDEKIAQNQFMPAEFIVDYVRAYQYKGEISA